MILPADDDDRVVAAVKAEYLEMRACSDAAAVRRLWGSRTTLPHEVLEQLVRDALPCDARREICTCSTAVC
jgi:hypothetical protein